MGAAFYWTLIRSLYRVMRIYDHSDAQAYEENLIEYAQEDDPANRDQSTILKLQPTSSASVSDAGTAI